MGRVVMGMTTIVTIKTTEEKVIVLHPMKFTTPPMVFAPKVPMFIFRFISLGLYSEDPVTLSRPKVSSPIKVLLILLNLFINIKVNEI